MKFFKAFLTASTFLGAATVASATDLEVTHWWTSGGEAAAVAELANAFDATGNKWVDGAIAGGGNTARPVMISRITGGDPMGATQFNHGRQTEELVEAGMMRPLTELAEKEGWKDVVRPSSLLDSCTVDGEIYCVPINIHSWEWLWLSNAAFEKAGVPVPSNWQEFVEAAPALKEAGITPLALGGQPWQAGGAFRVLVVALAGPEIYHTVYGDKDTEVAGGPELAEVFQALDDMRGMVEGANVQDWNQATNLVITGQAGGQIMGDWAQGEFQMAEQVAGEDYTCLPGLGVRDVMSTAGDSFYFPTIDDEDVAKAQEDLASVMLDPKVQVAFNLKKGSVPVRSDVDLEAANDCMKKGLTMLNEGAIVPSQEQFMSQDTINQINDLIVEFINTPSMTTEDTQKRFADLIGSAT